MPDFADAYLQKGRALYALGRDPEATEAFRNVLITNPDDLTALYGLARATDRQDLPKEAVTVYTRINQLEPSCERVFFL